MLLLICVDAKNKPDCIPLDAWLVEGDMYTCRNICQKTNGYVLEEIDISAYCKNEISFNRKRFLIATNDQAWSERKVKELLTEMNVNVSKR
jgi:hypothetical protein